MKTKTILILVILTTAAFACNAQTVSEKTVKGTTYVITQNKGDARKEVKNKNGLFDKYLKDIKSSCHVNIKDCNMTGRDLIKKIFTRERIAELGSMPKTNILIVSIYSNTGDAVAVRLDHVNTDVITWDEIKALENAYLQLKYVFDTSKCPDVKYYIIAQPINFSKFL